MSDKIFYKMTIPSNPILAEYADDEILHGAPNVCPEYGKAHFRIGWRGGDLVIILPSLNFGDFIWTWYSEMLATDRAVEILKAAGLTGFVTRPVTIRRVKRMGKAPKLIPTLWEVKVTGRGGDADPACGITLKYKCEYCKLRTYTHFNERGVIVNPNNWDGSDFFNVNSLPRFVLVTERVKEVVEKNRLKGCRFIPTTEIKTDARSMAEDITIIEWD